MSVFGMGCMVIPLLVLLPAAMWMALSWREKQRMRRAGIDANHPGCPTCLYLMRGWTTPNCPECGNDVRQSGVRIGPRGNLALKSWVLASVTFIVVLTVVRLFGDALCRWEERSISERVSMRLDMRGVAMVETVARRRVLPPERVMTTTVELLNDGERPQIVMSVDDAIPSTDAMHTMLANAFGRNSPVATRDVAEDVLAFIHRQRTQMTAAGGVLSTKATISVKGAASTTTRSPQWLGTASLTTAFLAAVGVGLLLLRFHRKPVRPVAEGEWMGASE